MFQVPNRVLHLLQFPPNQRILKAPDMSRALMPRLMAPRSHLLLMGLRRIKMTTKLSRCHCTQQNLAQQPILKASRIPHSLWTRQNPPLSPPFQLMPPRLLPRKLRSLCPPRPRNPRNLPTESLKTQISIFLLQEQVSKVNKCAVMLHWNILLFRKHGSRSNDNIRVWTKTVKTTDLMVLRASDEEYFHYRRNVSSNQYGFIYF